MAAVSLGKCSSSKSALPLLFTNKLPPDETSGVDLFYVCACKANDQINTNETLRCKNEKIQNKTKKKKEKRKIC